MNAKKLQKYSDHRTFMNVDVSASNIDVTYGFNLDDDEVDDAASETIAHSDFLGVRDYFVGALIFGYESQGINLVDCLSYTQSSKSKNFAKHFNSPFLGFICVPYASSDINEAQILACTGEMTVDGTAVSTEVDADTMFEFVKSNMPTISLSKSGDVFTAQLQDASGTNVSKADVEFFFETTTGYLSTTRAKTDANGQATTTLNDYVSGKVKVGFKNLSGVDEVEFTV